MLYQKELNKQQNKLMNTVIAVQDKERKRIAEDLHDSLGSILSAAKLKLSTVAETKNDNGQQANYEETMNLLDEAVNEMRSISHNLLPASLLRLGLVAGLQNLFDKIFSRSGLQISFITHGFKKRIDENVEVSIYRIVLEAINNIVKHAQAKNVAVQLLQYETYINVLIEDDGVGFDKSVVSKEQGIGLNNIFSRVDYMKGSVDIDTRPKAGTVINIDIPYVQTI
jgi:signal transduction histidine kinase